MANPIQGQVAFEADGESYRFVLNTYGLAAAERHLGKALPTLLAAGDLGFDAILGIFYGGLLKHHDLSVQQAADVVDAIGMDKAGQVVAEAMTLAFPDATGSPRKAKAGGTGKAS